MKKLTTHEWLAVTIALVVVGGSLIINIPALLSTVFQRSSPTHNTGAVGSETPSFELAIQDIIEGTGTEAKNGQLLTVHYRGQLLDGTVFDSSYDRGTPFQFVLGGGEVIVGWDRGLLGMREGGKRLLVIPPDLAYGANGVGPIPPNATLFFEVELVAVQ